MLKRALRWLRSDDFFVTPRLTSSFWVHALLRRCAGEGLFGAVLRKGAEEAGSVYVCINHLDGSYELLMAPPGSATTADGERVFAKAFAAPVTWAELSAYVERQARIDPDIWLVEIEDRTGFAGLQII